MLLVFIQNYFVKVTEDKPKKPSKTTFAGLNNRLSHQGLSHPLIRTDCCSILVKRQKSGLHYSMDYSGFSRRKSVLL